PPALFAPAPRSPPLHSFPTRRSSDLASRIILLCQELQAVPLRWADAAGLGLTLGCHAGWSRIDMPPVGTKPHVAMPLWHQQLAPSTNRFLIAAAKTLTARPKGLICPT